MRLRLNNHLSDTVLIPQARTQTARMVIMLRYGGWYYEQKWIVDPSDLNSLPAVPGTDVAGE